MLDWLGHYDFDEENVALLQLLLTAVTGHNGRPPKKDESAALILRNLFPAAVVEGAQQFVTDIARSPDPC